MQLLTLSGAAPGPQALRWFPQRPAALTDSELGEAERQVAALTPKGREMMQGLFPPEHFAAKMSMRQLVFSVEGSYSSHCSCDSCLRCRSAVERLHRQSHAGRSGGGKAADGATGGSHRGGASGKGGAAAAASDVDSALTLPEVGVLPDVAWAAVMAQQKDVARFFHALPRERRREALLLPAQELDRSMARSKDWDILVTAELDYDYGGGKNALVTYDSARDAFLPGLALCADGTKGAQLMLASLDPATTARAEAALWREPNGLAWGATEAEARAGKALGSYGRRSLELHFTRLFAVRLLARYAEAAREAAAQAALEDLLREEETEAAKRGEKEAKKKKKGKKKADSKAQAKARGRCAGMCVGVRDAWDRMDGAAQAVSISLC